MKQKSSFILQCEWTGALYRLCIFWQLVGDVAFTETEDDIVCESELPTN